MARVEPFAFITSIGLFAAANCLADEPDRAEELFRAGNRAFAAGDHRAAFTHYREAWSLRKSFDIACNLGRTEAELGFSRDATEHLDECLRTFSVSSRNEVKDAKARFRELFNRVRADVGAVAVDAHPSGVEISVDGVRYGTAPLGRELFVDPGQRRVRAHLLGYEEQETIVEVSAGGSAALNFELVKSSGVPAAAVVVVAPAGATASATATKPDAKAAPVRPAGMEPRTIVVLSGAALTAVGLGIGLGFTFDANSAGEHASDLSDSLAAGSAGCTASDQSPACEDLRSAIDHEEQSRDIARTAFLGTAITSAATFALWLVLPEFRSYPATGFQVIPRVSGRSEFGLMVSKDY